MATIKEITEELEGKYGVLNEDFCFIMLRGIPHAFRRPDLKEWDLFQTQLQAGKKAWTQLSRQLVRDTCLQPEKEDLDKSLERFPAFPPTIVAQFRVMVGDEIEVVGKGA